MGDKKKSYILDLFYRGVKLKVKDKVRLIIETDDNDFSDRKREKILKVPPYWVCMHELFQSNILKWRLKRPKNIKEERWIWEQVSTKR